MRDWSTPHVPEEPYDYSDVWRSRRLAREKMGVTQRKLAMKIGVGVDTLMKWESGASPSKLGERAWCEELNKLLLSVAAGE